MRDLLSLELRNLREHRLRAQHAAARELVVDAFREPRALRSRSGRPRAPRTTDARHGLPVAANVLARRFRTTAPSVAWVEDVTYLRTREGWRYLAVLLDLFSRRVVGYAQSECNDTALALSALRKALVMRSPAAGLIHHTDRGSRMRARRTRRCSPSTVQAEPPQRASNTEE